MKSQGNEIPHETPVKVYAYYQSEYSKHGNNDDVQNVYHMLKYQNCGHEVSAYEQ